MKVRCIRRWCALYVVLLTFGPAMVSAEVREPWRGGPTTDSSVRSARAGWSPVAAVSARQLPTRPLAAFTPDLLTHVKGSPHLLHPDSLARSIAAEIGREQRLAIRGRRSTTLLQQAGSGNRNWIQRHPVLLGTLVGFAGGYLIGQAAGDDAVFDDFSAEFHALVFGGIGAGTGALVGWAASR